ncbi:MAG TPA: LytTR family DNA-binding domain-containing protein [Saprospiraceae bacterium]|nr:LytTR family DNA-binding domain-containing protein [Saprospiraceae bacterium]
MQTATRIFVKTNRTIHLLSVNDILRCASESNYSFIYYGEGLKVYLAKTLKAMSVTLPESSFVRVHRSHIVRRDAIHLINNDHLVLINGEMIPVSRRYRKVLQTSVFSQQPIAS